MRKINDCIDNLRLLIQYKEISELFFSKKSFSLTRLCQSNPAFKEWLMKIAKQRAEKERVRQKNRVEPQSIAGKVNQNGLSAPAQQNLMSLSYPTSGSSNNLVPQGTMKGEEGK